MKKIICFAAFLCLILLFPSCSQKIRPYEELCENAFGARLEGMYNGMQADVYVSFEKAEEGTARNFFARLSGGALDGAVISCKNEKTTISLGALSEIPFSSGENGLLTLSKLLIPEKIVSRKGFRQNGEAFTRLTCETEGCSYFIITDKNANPLRIYSDTFNLNVDLT